MFYCFELSGGEENISHSVSSGLHSLSWDDATWILTSSFIIFTMQTGGCNDYITAHLFITFTMHADRLTGLIQAPSL